MLCSSHLRHTWDWRATWEGPRLVLSFQSFKVFSLFCFGFFTLIYVFPFSGRIHLQSLWKSHKKKNLKQMNSFVSWHLNKKTKEKREFEPRLFTLCLVWQAGCTAHWLTEIWHCSSVERIPGEAQGPSGASIGPACLAAAMGFYNRSVGCFVVWLFGWLVDWLLGCWVVWSLGLAGLAGLVGLAWLWLGRRTSNPIANWCSSKWIWTIRK